jgi:hypothetical protein
LRFKKEDRMEILNTMEKDAAILEKHNIMDYSLLFCIEKNPSFKKFNKSQRTGSSNSLDSDELEQLGNK